MRKTVTIFIACCLAFPTYAAIYKTDMSDGSVAFSDRPSQYAKKIILKSANLYKEGTKFKNIPPVTESLATPKNIPSSSTNTTSESLESPPIPLLRTP